MSHEPFTLSMLLASLMESKIEPVLVLPRSLSAQGGLCRRDEDSSPVGTAPGRGCWRRQDDVSTHWCRGTPNTGVDELRPSLVLSTRQ